jgi:hypothetical protein
MPVGVIIAVLVVIAIVAALAVAVPRMGGRARLGRRRPARRGPVPETGGRRDEPISRREERALIREGEAIRAHVEARLPDQRRVPVAPNPPVVADPAAVVPPDPAVYGTPGAAPDPAVYGTPGIAPDPAVYGTPGAAPDPAVYGTRGPVPDPAVYGTRGPVPDPAVYGTRGIAPDRVRPRRRRSTLSARDKLALQIDQSRHDAYDPLYPGGPPPVDPELLPQTSTSDALELQLQDIAAESRLRPPAVVPPGVSRRRRRLGFARPYSAFEDPEDDRIDR